LTNGSSSLGYSTPVFLARSREDVIYVGGIKFDDSTGVRSSGRLRAQHNADATQLERAMNVAQKKDDCLAQGTSQSRSSILAFSDSQIIHNASILGVYLGSSSVERINSARLIKDNEVHRTLTML
jgi:hypothetical protein